MDKQVQLMFAIALGLIVGATIGAQISYFESQFQNVIVASGLGGIVCSAATIIKNALA
jgi:hypothetical protein|tara:strand:- start:582 stop:755 length:174 start_codon:yes stop_codon:yes gene_type:complete